MDILFADLDAFVETKSFGATLVGPSLLYGLLHDVFQLVSVHPIPIQICYGLLRSNDELTGVGGSYRTSGA